MTTKEFERMQRLNMLKSLCFEDHALYSWTFDKDNGKNPIMWVAKDYVDKWFATFITGVYDVIYLL